MAIFYENENEKELVNRFTVFIQKNEDAKLSLLEKAWKHIIDFHVNITDEALQRRAFEKGIATKFAVFSKAGTPQPMKGIDIIDMLSAVPALNEQLIVAYLEKTNDRDSQDELPRCRIVATSKKPLGYGYKKTERGLEGFVCHSVVLVIKRNQNKSAFRAAPFFVVTAYPEKNEEVEKIKREERRRWIA